MFEPETPQQVLPSVVPLANLVISGLTLILMVGITARRWRLDRYVSRLLVVDLMVVCLCVVLLAGALFQSGFMGVDLWTVVGTGGRLVGLAGVAALLLQRWEYIPYMDSSTVPRDLIVRRAREEAAELLREAALVAAEKVRLEALEVGNIRRDVRRTADNTERIAESLTNGDEKG